MPRPDSISSHSRVPARDLFVLSIDGGGMRGLYAASVLAALERRFSRDFGSTSLKLGRGFDLIVGTSTGGILAAGLAAGVPLQVVRNFYVTEGPKIFTDPFPTGGSGFRYSFQLLRWLLRNLRSPANSNHALVDALQRIFGRETMSSLFARRHVALCLPSTSFLHQTPRIFKTPHLQLHHRDDNITIVDACLASSAAPIYLPLAKVVADGGGQQLHADGGLWANNPVLIGLIEGLALSEPDQRVVVFSVGTCPPTPGTVPSRAQLGLAAWRVGLLPLDLAMTSQAQASVRAAALLQVQLQRLGKQVHVLRFESTPPSASQAGLLRLDAATPKALELLQSLGDSDGQLTYRWCQTPEDSRGEFLLSAFARMAEA